MSNNQNKEDNVPLRKKKFWKFWVVMFLLNIGFLAVVVKLFNIQVLQAEYYQKLAKNQHETKKTLYAKRGTIYDRNNKVIAVSIDSYSIAADPTILKKENIPIIADILARATGNKPELYIKKINDADNQFIWLQRGLQPNQAEEIRAITDRGLLIFNEPKRRFPYTNAAAQLVGLIDIDNNGLSGIERAFDSLLKGENGWKIMYKDAFQKLHTSADLPYQLPKNGSALKLTIDIELQEIVEYELKMGALAFNAASATAVAIKPKTGEILAIASYPGFDPNSSDKGPVANRRIRAITDTYEPGSTFKIFTAAAAMQENLVSEEDTVNGRNGYLAVRNRVIRDVHGMGRIPFRKAVEQSSNVVFASLADSLNDRTFYKYIRDFGFGLKTGIELHNETSGKVPKPEDYNATSKHYMGHGYGLSVSPLQITNAYAAIANGGVLMRSHLVKEIIDNQGEVIQKFEPMAVRRVISEDIAKRIAEMFKGVVTNGTGKAAKIEGMNIAGKTGTSQQLENGIYSKRFYNASFAGFFPAEDPQFALMVIVDKPQGSYYGGSVAAPIFRNISLRWATSGNIDVSGSQLNAQDEILFRDSIYVPYLLGLDYDGAYSLCDNLGFDIAIPENKGIVIKQNPKAGNKVEYGSIIDITSMPKDDRIAIKDTLKPDVVDLPLGRAIALLHACGYQVKIYGSGKVVKQIWLDKQKKVELHCK